MRNYLRSPFLEKRDSLRMRQEVFGKIVSLREGIRGAELPVRQRSYYAMIRLFAQLLLLGLAAALAGCASSEESKPSGTSTSPGKKSVGSVVVQPDPGLPAGEFGVLIDSDPPGAIIVVNGIPIGKAPQKVVLPGSSHGFFRDQVSLKVRFIAADNNQASQTVEEMLTPLDRIPSTVRFTRAGASRLAR